MLSLMFAIMACVSSPSVACADVTIGAETLHGWTVNEAVSTWSPQDMTNDIGENTGVKVEQIEPDNSQSDSNPAQIIEAITSAAPVGEHHHFHGNPVDRWRRIPDDVHRTMRDID